MRIENIQLKVQNFLSKHVWSVLVIIIIIGGILRLWQLGSVPISPDWDEVALGYNAFSILHTARDEYGTLLPVVLRSFDDYKPALYTYLSIPTVGLFGLNTFAVRLPSAVFGILTILLVFLLVKELFKKDSIALLSSFLLAISPWHIQFSRVAFETNIGLFLNILGVLLFLKAFKKPWLMIIAGGVFALNLYAYQSEKVFTPLLILSLVIVFHKNFLALRKKAIILSILIACIVAFPMFLFITTNKNALLRAAGVSVFAQQTNDTKKNADRLLYDQQTHDNIGKILDNRRVFYAKEVISNYFSHWNINWLFVTGDIERHHAPGMGLMYLWELPFLLIGIFLILFGEFDKKTKWLIVLWFLIAPIPASVTTGVPHAVRTLNFLPTMQIFTALGVLSFWTFLKEKKNTLNVILILIVACLALFNFSYYIDQYFVQTNYFYAPFWQYGYEQGVSYVMKNKNAYKHIIVSNSPTLDQSYMFFLFYLKYPPKLYQKAEAQHLFAGLPADHVFDTYQFRQIKFQDDSKLENTLFVGTSADIKGNAVRILKKINNPDGSEALVIFVKQ